MRLFVFKHIWLRWHPLCSFYCKTVFLCVLFIFLSQSLMYKVNGVRQYLRLLYHWCEKCNWGGIIPSKALHVMHISPCLEAKEIALSMSIWNLLEAMSTWQWFWAQVLLCSAISPSPSGLISVAVLLKMLCVRKKLNVSGINLDQLYFSCIKAVVTS